MRSDVMAYPVCAGQEDSLDELAATLTMVNGGTVEIAPDWQTAKINDGHASAPASRAGELSVS